MQIPRDIQLDGIEACVFELCQAVSSAGSSTEPLCYRQLLTFKLQNITRYSDSSSSTVKRLQSFRNLYDY